MRTAEKQDEDSHKEWHPFGPSKSRAESKYREKGDGTYAGLKPENDQVTDRTIQYTMAIVIYVTPGILTQYIANDIAGKNPDTNLYTYHNILTTSKENPNPLETISFLLGRWMGGRV